MATAPVRCAVLGSPIAHSLSPVLHRAAYAALGLDWAYDAVEVDEASLPGFLDGLGAEWRGLSLTMPLKRAVLPLLDSQDAWASTSGAANTVVLDGDRRHGANTDVPGAVTALRRAGVDRLDSVVVLGGGATATSLLLAATELGCSRATVLVRDPARAAETVSTVTAEPHAPAVEVGLLGDALDAVVGVDALLSTIPADAQGDDLAQAVRAAAVRLRVVFEATYDPAATPLTSAAADAGVPLVTGLDLLVEQAALQVALMADVPVDDVPVERMRAALPR